MNANLTSPSRTRTTALVATRFMMALCLALWIGGLAFFGIMAAPVLFHPERSGIERAANTAILAPQMVSAMLTRFGTLTTILGVALVIGALLDGVFSRGLKTRLWQVQAALCVFCLGFSLFLNGVLLPQTKRDQAEILPLISRAASGAKLSPADQARRAAFDRGHSGYQRLASLNIYLLLAVLLLVVARGAAVSKDSSESGLETVK